MRGPHRYFSRDAQRAPDQNWDERCHIVTFPVAGDAKMIWAALPEKRIAVKDGYLRVSMGFFNKEEELDILLRAVDAL